uniref:Uncharacterized protein n=1 Tax=Arundo donax TaxID=35708 RepID=A0A0A9G1N1_ARUDO
MLLLCLHQ